MLCLALGVQGFRRRDGAGAQVLFGILLPDAVPDKFPKSATTQKPLFKPMSASHPSYAESQGYVSTRGLPVPKVHNPLSPANSVHSVSFDRPKTSSKVRGKSPDP